MVSDELKFQSRNDKVQEVISHERKIWSQKMFQSRNDKVQGDTHMVDWIWQRRFNPVMIRYKSSRYVCSLGWIRLFQSRNDKVQEMVELKEAVNAAAKFQSRNDKVQGRP